MRAKAIVVIERMRGMGYEAHFVSDASDSGQDGAEAVRITGRRLGQEGPGKRFWLHLGAACIASRMRWGGFDGLTAHQHAELRSALVAGDFDRAMGMKLGADPARVECAT